MDLPTLLITTILGIGVLISYYIIFIQLEPGNYLTHKYWFGIDKNIVIVLICFQILAIIGFIMSMITWIIEPPEGGVMGNNSYALPLTIAFFMVTATIWPIAVYTEIHWLVITSLIGTAICSIVLLAGSIEENNQRWWVVLGFILLSIVTVLGDGVLWNANYIKKLLYKS